MGIKIGSARIDENGNISGGVAGDQTGTEVSTQDYYMHSKGWYLNRPIAVEDANSLASAMLAACENDNIGYCQGHRTTVITMLRKYGSMAAIKEKTEADCGTLVRGCCIEAGFDPGNFTTANESEALYKTGKFESKVDVTASTVLYDGDILVTKTKGHTVIVVSGNPRKASSSQTTQKTESAKVEYAKSKDDSLAGKYVVTVNSYLALRAGAGTSKDELARMKNGETVQCYGFYTAVSGVKWYLVQYGALTGFCSSEYLRKK